MKAQIQSESRVKCLCLSLRFWDTGNELWISVSQQVPVDGHRLYNFFHFPFYFFQSKNIYTYILKKYLPKKIIQPKKYTNWENCIFVKCLFLLIIFKRNIHHLFEIYTRWIFLKIFCIRFEKYYYYYYEFIQIFAEFKFYFF